MQITYSVKPDDFVAFNMSYMQNSPVMRANVRNTRLLSAAIVFVGGCAFMYAIDKLNVLAGIVYALAAVAIYFLLPKMIEKKVKNSVLKMVLNPKNMHICSDKTLTLGEESLSLVGGGEDSSYKYDSVEYIEEDAEHYYIYVGPMAAVIVPKRAFESETHKKEFYSLLCERILHSGGKISR